MSGMTFGENELRAICEKALKATDGDQAEATIVARNAALTRFANAAIHQNVVSREAELQMQFRTVPGQTLQSIRDDLARLLDGIRRDHPAFNFELTLPVKGTDEGWCQDPMECPTDHPLVQALATRIAPKT